MERENVDRQRKASSCCGDGKQAAAQDAAHETKLPSLEILKERFARGEIDNADFEERHQVLAGM